MRKLLRGLLCGGMLAVLLCTGAFAAESGIRIELNGEDVIFQDAMPQIINDRTYLPFRAVFVALGFADEDITFLGESRTVMAVSDELTVSMKIGEKKVTVVKNGETSVLETDVPAFIDPQLGRTYVPVSFVAQAVGYRVGWNGQTRTVILEDLEKLFENNSHTYQVLEGYLAYSRELHRNNYQVDGVITARIDGEGMNLATQGGFGMVMDGSMNFDMDTRLALTGTIGDSDPSAALPEGIQLELRGNLAKGPVWFRSEEVSLLSGGVAQAWYLIEQNDILDHIVLNVLDREPEQGEVRDYVEKLVRESIQENNALSAAKQLEILNRVLADSAFVRINGQYVSGMQSETTGLSVSFHSEGNRMQGYHLVFEHGDFCTEILLLNGTLQAVYHMEEDGAQITLGLEGTMTPTQQRPSGKPDGGDYVIEDMN